MYELTKTTTKTTTQATRRVGSVSASISTATLPTLATAEASSPSRTQAVTFSPTMATDTAPSYSQTQRLRTNATSTSSLSRRTLVDSVEGKPWGERVRIEQRFYERAHVRESQVASIKPPTLATQAQVSETYNTFSTKQCGPMMTSPVTATHSMLTRILAERVNATSYASRPI